MKLNYLETTFKVYDESRQLINEKVNEEIELTPDEGKALLNLKNGKKYASGHVISKDETPEDYQEVEAK